jgi:hypothetical protein
MCLGVVVMLQSWELLKRGVFVCVCFVLNFCFGMWCEVANCDRLENYFVIRMESLRCQFPV